jgi:hypothetical protein
MRDAHAVVAIVGAALVGMAGPVLMVWVSNAPQRLLARAAVVLDEEDEDDEDVPDIGWLPGNER